MENTKRRLEIIKNFFLVEFKKAQLMRGAKVESLDIKDGLMNKTIKIKFWNGLEELDVVILVSSDWSKVGVKYSHIKLSFSKSAVYIPGRLAQDANKCFKYLGV